MATKTEQFLALYKEYEICVRNAGLEPKMLEDAMDEASAGRMRMIRLFRNYLSHNHDPGFLEPTDAMLAYLAKELQSWQLRGDVAGKHLKRPASCICKDTDRVYDVVEKLLPQKKEAVVIATKDGYAIYSLFTLAQAALSQSKATKVKSIPSTKKKPRFVSPTTKMDAINPQDVTLCTSDGTAKGKLLGLVIF